VHTKAAAGLNSKPLLKAQVQKTQPYMEIPDELQASAALSPWKEVPVFELLGAKLGQTLYER
jgi:hypothetical protein